MTRGEGEPRRRRAQAPGREAQAGRNYPEAIVGDHTAEIIFDRGVREAAVVWKSPMPADSRMEPPTPGSTESYFAIRVGLMAQLLAMAYPDAMPGNAPMGWVNALREEAQHRSRAAAQETSNDVPRTR